MRNAVDRRNIPPHLHSYLDVAAELPITLEDVPLEAVERLQKRLVDLVILCANREATIAKLEARIEAVA